MRLPEWFNEAKSGQCPTGCVVKRERFVDRSLRSIARYMRDVAATQDAAAHNGLLQALDARVRISGMLILIAASAVTVGWFVLIGVLFISAALAYASRVSLRALARRIVLPFIFTAVIISPVFFGIGAQGQGASFSGNAAVFFSGAFIIFRVTVMATLSALLVLTTRQADFFKGLSGLPVPPLFVTALFMTFRYLFILIKTAEDAAMARKSRVIMGGRIGEPQAWFASRAALLLHKSLSVAMDVNMAMVSRGFSGGKLMTTGHKPMKARDYLWLGAASFVFFLSLAGS